MVRRWTKIHLAEAPPLPASTTPAERYARQMGGYGADADCATPDTFLRRYFSGRLQTYHRLLIRHLRPGMRVLCLGSGRCVNELLLARHGCRVTACDLAYPPCLAPLQAACPALEFRAADITRELPVAACDAVVALSVFYHFPPAVLRQLAQRIAAALPPGGVLLCDVGGAADSLLTRLLDEVVVPLDQYWYRYVRRAPGWHLQREVLGYRYTDREVTAIFTAAGLQLQDVQRHDHRSELWRSWFCRHRLQGTSRWRPLLERLGAQMPYVRLFRFTRPHAATLTAGAS